MDTHEEAQERTVMHTEEKIVRTESRFRAWYLTTFCGLKVRTVLATPIMPLLGAVVYSRCWVLAPA